VQLGAATAIHLDGPPDDLREAFTAAGLPRQLHALIVTATPWNAAIAAGHRDEQGAAAAA